MGRWYRVKLDPDDNDTFLVTSPQFPEVTTFGADQKESLLNGRRAIEEAMAARVAAGDDIPPPLAALPKKGWFIEIPVLIYLKGALYIASRAKGITRAEIARRMHVHREQVDRLFRFDHNSRMDQIEAAFKAVDVPLNIDVPLSSAA
jgi:antitoxin HicB